MNFNFLDEGCLIYTFLFFLTFISIIFVTGKKERNAFFWIIVILEILVSSLRGTTVGADTYGYAVNIIPQLKSLSYKEILHAEVWMVEKEPVCYCFLKFISDPFKTYTPYFFILETIFWLSIADTIRRYSKDPLLTLLVFIAFRFSFFNMSAVRQCIALAITTFSYRYYVNDKKWYFVLFVALAFLFHRSAIIFILLLFTGKINLLKHQWLVYVMAVGFAFMSYVFSSVIGFGTLDDSEIVYMHYVAKDKGGGNYFSVAFMLIMFVLVSLFIVNNKKTNRYVKEYNIMVLSLLFSMAGLFVSLFFRISMYFSFLVPILFANTLKDIKPNSVYQQWLAVGLVLMLVIYVCTGVVDAYTPYKFYWE